jgi:hypothetical protein
LVKAGKAPGNLCSDRLELGVSKLVLGIELLKAAVHQVVGDATRKEVEECFQHDSFTRSGGTPVVDAEEA